MPVTCFKRICNKFCKLICSSSSSLIKRLGSSNFPSLVAMVFVSYELELKFNGCRILQPVEHLYFAQVIWLGKSSTVPCKESAFTSSQGGVLLYCEPSRLRVATCREDVFSRTVKIIANRNLVTWHIDFLSIDEQDVHD